jgi:acetyl esterase
MVNPLRPGTWNFENPFIQWICKLCWRYGKYFISWPKLPADLKQTIVTIPTSDHRSISCRIIEPIQRDENKKLPVIVMLHGGGLVFPLHPMLVRHAMYYAKMLPCKVVIPEYRSMLDYSFLIPINDCYDTLLYIKENGKEYGFDVEKILVYGNSAGGYLAAVLAHMARDKNGPVIRGQVLIYPGTDNDQSYPSLQNKHAVWTGKANRHVWNIYLKKGVADAPLYAIPMRAANFSNLPPAYVEVAEMDTLRDQGVAYAEKMKAGGVPVEIAKISGADHAFDHSDKNPQTQEALQKRVSFMKTIL